MIKAVLTAALALGMASGAMAQTVDQRHMDQQRRIDQGIRSGELTPGETGRLEHQQASVDRQEARMRDRDGGRLTRQDRRILQRRENRASAHIWRAKHNARVG